MEVLFWNLRHRYFICHFLELKKLRNFQIQQGYCQKFMPHAGHELYPLVIKFIYHDLVLDDDMMSLMTKG